MPDRLTLARVMETRCSSWAVGHWMRLLSVLGVELAVWRRRRPRQRDWSEPVVGFRETRETCVMAFMVKLHPALGPKYLHRARPCLASVPFNVAYNPAFSTCGREALHTGYFSLENEHLLPSPLDANPRNTGVIPGATAHAHPTLPCRIE
jgi:hypothetical protein